MHVLEGRVWHGRVTEDLYLRSAMGFFVVVCTIAWSGMQLVSIRSKYVESHEKDVFHRACAQHSADASCGLTCDPLCEVQLDPQRLCSIKAQ